jgi:hypothetical protein
MPWNPNFNWTSADTLRNAPKETLLDLVAALNERQQTLNPSVLPPISTDIRNKPPRLYAEAVDFYMGDGFYAAFAKQTDNSGEWNGKATIPVWTEADLEAEIGASRPPFVNYGELTADWVWWMYKALNLLVWTRNWATGLFTTTTDVTQYIKHEDGDRFESWASCVTDFNALSFFSGTFFYPYFEHYARSSNNGFGGRRYDIHRKKVDFDLNGIPTHVNHQLVWYIYVQRESSSGVYENNDFTLPENTWLKAYTGTVNGLAQEPNIIGGDYNSGNNSVSEPNPQPYNRGYIAGGGGNYYVLKWNVSGGFEYVD